MLVTDNGGVLQLDPAGVPFGPTESLLGVLEADGTSTPLHWGAPVTETPTVGDTEIWEIHIRQIQFEVTARKGMATGVVRSSEPWERGYKDTVIAYPGEITRVRMRFELPGLFVWHCHIIEHEDNEMMRPYRVLPAPGN